MDRDPSRQRWPWGRSVIILLVFVSVTAAAGALFVNFGPPRVALQETYAEKPDSPAFDHSVFDKLVRKHVDKHGWVDYAGLEKEAGQLEAYQQALAAAPFDKMGRSEKLALLINAYNAFTLQLILDYRDGGKLESIKHIPAARRWKHKRWNVGGHVWSLNDIEHKQIRPKFKEPRIHFALVCAAYSCPKLRNEAFTAKKLDKQLENQTHYSHAHERWLKYDASKNVVALTALYDWYGDDFVQTAGSVLGFVAKYSPPVKEAMDAGNPPRVRFLKYSWKLNSRANAP